MVFLPCSIIRMALVRSNRFERTSTDQKNFFCLGHSFSGTYNEYFGLATDTESFNYLQLANYVSQTLYPESITVAEV